MDQRMIFITEFDLQRLQELIREARRADRRPNAYLDDLEQELALGKVVAPKDVPADVITMNSKVRLVDLDSREEMIYTLVFPADANRTQSKISILAPIGTAMLGYRVGDTFDWEVPDGLRRLKVIEVLYQPEASGNFDL